jgi:Holliday junction resolvase
MGKPSRDKGARRERQVVEMHREMGVKAERVPLSGAMRFRNTEKTDVDVYARGAQEAPFVTEVKARAGGEGFVTLERWLGENDALFLIRDRASPLVVLPWDRWAELLKRGLA